MKWLRRESTKSNFQPNRIDVSRLSLVTALLLLDVSSLHAAEGRLIATGHWHSCAVRQDRTVACWGSNLHGELGTGETGGDQSTPRPVKGLSNVVSISAGDRHTCALTKNGEVYCWGGRAKILGNAEGKDGDDVGDQAIALKVSGVQNAVAVASSLFDSCVISAAGSVACWGSNKYSPVGSGAAGSARPTEVASLHDLIALANGGDHKCGVQRDRRVVCWGLNDSGQLGNESPTTHVIEVKETGMTALAAGARHTCAILPNRDLSCWGSNRVGQLGIGHEFLSAKPGEHVTLKNVISVAASDGHSCALVHGGAVACWGTNEHDEVGLGKPSEPIFLPHFVAGIADAIDVSTGAEHTCVIRKGGRALCWGTGNYGQLGKDLTEFAEAPPSR